MPIVNDIDLNTLRRRDASRAFRFVSQPSLEGALTELGRLGGDVEVALGPPASEAASN